MDQRVTFGVFEFEPISGTLSRDGRPVRLQRQPAKMLAALVAQPGEIVERAALQAAIWGSETNVDFERGLNFCAAQIRAALRDSAASPRYIETLPRRGYRFIAPVRPTTGYGLRVRATELICRDRQTAGSSASPLTDDCGHSGNSGRRRLDRTRPARWPGSATHRRRAIRQRDRLAGFRSRVQEPLGRHRRKVCHAGADAEAAGDRQRRRRALYVRAARPEGDRRVARGALHPARPGEARRSPGPRHRAPHQDERPDPSLGEPV